MLEVSPLPELGGCCRICPSCCILVGYVSKDWAITTRDHASRGLNNNFECASIMCWSSDGMVPKHCCWQADGGEIWFKDVDDFFCHRMKHFSTMRLFGIIAVSIIINLSATSAQNFTTITGSPSVSNIISKQPTSAPSSLQMISATNLPSAEPSLTSDGDQPQQYSPPNPIPRHATYSRSY